MGVAVKWFFGGFVVVVFEKGERAAGLGPSISISRSLRIAVWDMLPVFSVCGQRFGTVAKNGVDELLEMAGDV